ncbi:MAG: SDR family oxidoreductase [Candidatus Kapabacteria bacterium]|nr:SDR family oxidoreductase [Candidatus Kapabacteria bacterium]
MTKKTIFITGSTGKVAEATYKLLCKEGDFRFVLHTSSDEDLHVFNSEDKVFRFDIKDKIILKEILNTIKPDIIINPAALTNVDLCEDDRKLAWDMNVLVVENLEKYCKLNECKLITFSTDYIFDGKKGPYLEEDIPSPISYYGKTKLAAENIIKASNSNCAIIRTNVVYGNSSYAKDDFIKWLIKKFTSNEKMNIITGQYCNPTFVDDVAYSVYKIIDKDLKGVYNIAGKDYVNRYEIALKVAKVYGFDPSLISPIESSKLHQKAKRPENGGLITLKAETEFGFNFTSLENGLNSMKLLSKQIVM